MSNTRNDNIQLVKNVIDVINSGDTTNVSDFIGPTYYNHESQMDPVRSKMRGPEEFSDTVANLRKAFSDLRYELVDSVSSNKKVIAIVSVVGKHTGSFFGFIPPSGNKYPIKQYICSQLVMMEKYPSIRLFAMILH
jgi:nogalonic acid methyl ester cyclase/aklanonic acid methyl ester cyclase